MKSVLVTGGAGGIGEAICLKFAEKGYFVGVGYNNSEAEAKKIAEKIGGAAIKIDVTDAESVNSAVESFAKQSGTNGAINVLVNCAGIALPIKTLLDVTEAEYDKIFAVNMKGVFLSVKAVLPHMLEKGGAIINVSSMWGLAGGSCEAVYSASKSAVIGFTKALAKEFAGANIRKRRRSGFYRHEDEQRFFGRGQRTYRRRYPARQIRFARRRGESGFISRGRRRFRYGHNS